MRQSSTRKNDNQEAPVAYRLPPARLPMPPPKVHAGCWPVLLILLALLLLLLVPGRGRA